MTAPVLNYNQFGAPPSNTASGSGCVNSIVYPINHVNRLPNPSFETNTTGWFAGAASSISRVTTQFEKGIAALQVTKTGGAGTAYVNTNVPDFGQGPGFSVTAGETITVVGWVKGSVSRLSRIRVAFYNATPTYLGDLPGVDVSSSTSGWTKVTTTGVVPAGATQAALELQVAGCALNENHWWDAVDAHGGSDTTYNPSGTWPTIPGHLHDMGGPSATTPNGTNPAQPSGTYTFWQDLAGPWYRVEWLLRIDIDTHATPAGYYWALQGQVRNAAGTGGGSTWYAGLQSKSSLSGNPKALNFAIWDADGGVAGDIPGTVSQPFGGEGEGWQIMAPYDWVAGRTYRLRFTKDPARGARWFAIYITDLTTGVQTYHGSIQANSSNGSDVAGVAYQWSELFSQATPATTCPLLPRSTVFFGVPDFSTVSGDVPGSPPPAGPAAAWLPTGANNPNNHTTTTVYNALTGRTGSRSWSFRYELLNSSNTRIMDLEEVLTGKVEWQYLADIKRQASFTIRDRGRINYLRDRLRVWIRLHLSPFGPNDWVEWPMGVFLLNSPTRHAGEVDTVDREVTAYDPTWAMEDDKVMSRAGIPAGTNLVTAALSQVTTSLAIPNDPKWYRVTRSTETMPATKEWPPGTSRRQICNDLLAMAEYESISFDGLGRAVLQPYKDPNTRPISWTYTYGQEGLIIPDVDQELDLFNIPNKVLIVVSEPDQPMIVASATNSNPASITSTVRRGRTIVDFRDAEEAASQTVLNARATRILREHAQVYEHLRFQTGLMPIHGFNDVLHIDYDPLAINTRYHETSWTVELEAGAPMAHEVRRLVTV